MIRLITLYGIAGGLIVAVPLVVLMTTLTPETAPKNGAVYGYLTMIVALTTVFLGIKHYRDRVLGGAIKFGPALLVGLGISAVASLIYDLGWEISIALTGFDYGASYSRAMMAAAQAKGASPAELHKVAAEAASFARMYAHLPYRMAVTFLEMFPVGVLISVISAALLRDSRLLPARARA
jgi:hypothetical protein